MEGAGSGILSWLRYNDYVHSRLGKAYQYGAESVRVMPLEPGSKVKTPTIEVIETSIANLATYHSNILLGTFVHMAEHSHKSAQCTPFKFIIGFCKYCPINRD